MILTQIQAVATLISGLSLIVTRWHGNILAFVCFALRAATVENGYLVVKQNEGGPEGKRSAAIGFLKVVIVGLVCLLMNTKRKPIIHRADLID